MIKLIIYDEVNCQFEGIEPEHLAVVRSDFSYFVKGYFTQAAFKAGVWDGKESLINEEGITFNYLIPDIVDVLETKCGVDLSIIEIEDNRNTLDFIDEIEPIDENFLKDALGFKLRDYQVESVNNSIESVKGIIHAGTASGKTGIQLGLVKLLHPYIKTVTMVPSADLAKQTYKDYIKCDEISDDVLLLESKVPVHKREEKIRSHKHIVVTTKLFQNLSELFDEDYALLYDEAHVLGDITADRLRFDLGHCPIRIGLTGTLPTDQLKRMKLLCHIGGDVIKRVTSHHLMENDYASKFHIDIIPTVDKEIEHEIIDLASMEGIEGKDVYDFEMKYLLTNEHRIAAIADYIQEFDLHQNTLILCHPQLGNKLAKVLDTVMIDGDDVSDYRSDNFSRFDEEDGVLICASYGTSSTGISYNRIKRLILIDAGKNINTVIQSIGRGMRLDGEGNWFDVIDIDANTKYAKRHRKERIKAYKNEKYDYTELKTYIAV